MERKKIVRIAMKITEEIIGILKQEFGDKNENRQKKAKKVRKTNRKAVSRVSDGNSN